MRSHELCLERYDTDKVRNDYLRWYDPILQPLVGQKITLLELGVHNGGSLRLWRDYFPGGTVVGIDRQLPSDAAGEERIHMFQGSQDDTGFLSDVARRMAPSGFDLIIDDASHIGTLTRVAFWHLFDNHLKSSGLYAIEDWGTGYWDDWPDGRSYQAEFLRAGRGAGDPRAPWPSHTFGMVGFVKQLVDEQGAADLTRTRLARTATRQSKFERMVITPSIVFITKRAQ
jgi:hypothetical protein